MSSERLLVIGLDAGDKDLIDTWVASGDLPNFARLRETGLSGDIENPRGLEAGACWPAFYFGVSPAKSGQFDGALYFNPQTYNHEGLRTDTSPVKPVWQVFSEQGKKVGVIDAPYNFALNDPIDGIKINDRASHVPSGGGNDCEFRTFPASLSAEIVEKFGGDPADGHSSDYWSVVTPDEVRAFVNLYATRIRNKTDMALHLLSQDRFDFFLCVFTEMHCVGHRCWHIHDTEHPLHDPQLLEAAGNPVKALYVEMDKAIGRFLENADDQTNVVVFCSHGMGPQYTATFLLDRILAKLDNQDVAMRTGLVFQTAKKIWRSMPDAMKRPLQGVRNSITNDGFQPNRQGRRFFEVRANNRTGGIRINLKGREARGIVDPSEYDALCDEIIEALSEIKNVDTGEPIIEEIFKTRDEYSGPQIDRLPDILATWNRKAGPIERVTSPKIGVIDKTGLHQSTAGGTPGERTGDHWPVGRFYALGPDLPAQVLNEKIKVYDMIPTFSSLLQVEPPAEGDGEPIAAVLDAKKSR